MDGLQCYVSANIIVIRSVLKNLAQIKEAKLSVMNKFLIGSLMFITVWCL